MEYIKNNKLTVLIMTIFVVVVVLGAYVYNVFFVGGRKEAYGNRLDGIENVEITKEQYTTLKTKLKENTNVVDVSTNLKGKIVNVIITVKDSVSKDDAKKIGDKVINSKVLDEEQLNFYDIQIFIKKDNAELNDFPIIGYKQNGKKGLTWTKDRQVTKDETK